MTYEAAPEVDVFEALESAQSEKAGDRQLLTSDIVAELAGGKTKAELAQLIQGRTGCAQGSAYRAIDRAEEAKCIRLHRTSRTYQDIRPNA